MAPALAPVLSALGVVLFRETTQCSQPSDTTAEFLETLFSEGLPREHWPILPWNSGVRPMFAANGDSGIFVGVKSGNLS